MTSYHRRQFEAEMDNPEFAAEYKRARTELAQVNAVVRELDALREEAGISKAELARRIGRTDSSIRRLFSAEVNPELRTLAAIAQALGTEIQVKRVRGRRLASSKVAPRRKVVAATLPGFASTAIQRLEEPSGGSGNGPGGLYQDLAG